MRGCWRRRAALLEIDAADPFRIRSYRRAAEAVEQQTTQLAGLVGDPKQLLAIPGIGKGMAANICELVATGTMPIRVELLTKYKATMLELLRLPGMGPKTVALVWSALGVSDIDALEAAAKEGKLAELPRMGEKFTAKLLKGTEDYRRNTGRFRIDHARHEVERISKLIFSFRGSKRSRLPDRCAADARASAILIYWSPEWPARQTRSPQRSSMSRRCR